MVTEMIYFLWKLEFEAVNESRLPFFVGLSGKFGEKVEKLGKSPNWKLLRSKQVGGKVVKSGKSPKLKNKD